ncbi:unnamed protein product, partial [Allacma fusca]
MKNQEISILNEKQALEMSNATSNMNSTTTDVNTLATIHFEEAHMVQT